MKAANEIHLQLTTLRLTTSTRSFSSFYIFVVHSSASIFHRQQLSHSFKSNSHYYPFWTFTSYSLSAVSTVQSCKYSDRAVNIQIIIVRSVAVSGRK